MVQAVWKVDGLWLRSLSISSSSFSFTPINTGQAWSRFQRDGSTVPPTLTYRPLPFDPVVLKRRLYRAPVERIEDPVWARSSGRSWTRSTVR